LRDGVGIAMDLSRYLELTADQANPDAQLAVGALLRHGIIKIRYFKFAAEQRVAETQYRYGIALLAGEAGYRNIAEGIRHLQLSADQFVVACIAENAIGLFLSFRRFCNRDPPLRAMH
jgi:TPR repeat protein